jgi:N-acetylneuraminate synthase
MDPFSPNPEQRAGSLDILERTMAFAQRLQDLSRKPVPVVGSFSVVHDNLDRFYEDYAGLVASYQGPGVDLLPQWLPPIAWYFGGSVRLHTFNALDDVAQVKKHGMVICMDVCHLLMGQNFHGFSAGEVLDHLSDETRHVHIADAAGFDAEGLQIGEGEPQNLAIIERALGFNCMKVIEVWQGHFDRGAGFKKALAALYRLHHG